MPEVEEGVFGRRVIQAGDGDERLGWEGWFAMFVAAATVVLSGLLLPPWVGVASEALPVPDSATTPLDPARVMLGLGLAVAMIAGAVWLVRRTDWGATEGRQ